MCTKRIGFWPNWSRSVAGRNFAAVGFPRHEALAGDAVRRAVGEEAPLDAGIGPIEAIDAEGLVARRQSERHGMKKRPSKVPISTSFAADAEFALASDQVPADGGGKARGHAAHLFVAVRQVAIDGG